MQPDNGPDPPADAIADSMLRSGPTSAGDAQPQEYASSDEVESGGEEAEAHHMHLSIHALSTRIEIKAAPGQDAAEKQPLPSDASGAAVSVAATGRLRELHRGSVQEAMANDNDCAELTRRLRHIFELDDSEELSSCHPCWLFRSILLQGYLYIMTSHLCFYANLPSRQDKVIRIGSLRKRTRRTHRLTTHWAILRGRTLSWYESQTDPFFPQDQIDLRDVSDVRTETREKTDGALATASTVVASDSGQLQFTVSTSYRSFLFEADTPSSCEAWVASIRKAVFRAQNEGESVRINIPLETILDVDSSNANPLAGHTTKAEREQGLQDIALVTVKVIQSTPGEAELTMDEYFFTNMADEAQFLEKLREKMSIYVSSHQQQLGQVRASIGAMTVSGAKPISIQGNTRRATSAKGSMTPTMPVRAATTTFTHPNSDLEAELAEATIGEAFVGTPPMTSILSNSVRTLRSFESPIYPPSPQSAGSVPLHLSNSVSSVRSIPYGERKWAVPQWLRLASTRLALNTSENLQALASRIPHRAVRETWSALPRSLQTGMQVGRDTAEDGGDVSSDAPGVPHDEGSMTDSIHSDFSILEVGSSELEENDIKEQEVALQFQQTFSLPDAEQLLYHTSTNLYRVLPVAGRLFVSTAFVCFRSSRLATKTMGRTLMILPRSEIISVAKNNAVQYGRHGLVIVVRGHEELFFEFTSPERRDQTISVIESLAPDEQKTSAASRKHEYLGALHDDIERETSITPDVLLLTDAALPALTESISESASLHQASPSMFGSMSSSFLSPIKPRENLHFTLLTIGSRGDVQPYIALACGLKREGHRVRIATHGEFGKWIESFGIEFYEVGGDPAELMRICIENGTFTLAFVRESMTRFRGWLDDLLVSSWHACQGTDVIIESPSAMAGIHVAEALRVPYYRGFTMPWTRTRAYPHAFAVPSRRAGGNYNYMSYVIFEQVLWRVSAGQVNAWRKRWLQLHATNLHLLQTHKVPFLYNFSPKLVPKPLDWSDWIHVTGFWFLDNADEASTGQEVWSAPPELVNFIEDTRQQQRKLVYIGWGSIVIQDADAVLQIVVEAVRKSGVRAIISRGWSDRLKEDRASHAETPQEAEADPTENDVTIDGKTDTVWQDIFTVQSVPHDWLFPQLDVACHHGGSGTLGASLRAGVPTIVRPFFGDQFFWASQVESLQIGANIANPFTAERFASALTVCSTDERMKRNARLMAEALRKEDGVGNAIRAIYADWDYACSLIPLDTQSPRKANVEDKAGFPPTCDSPSDGPAGDNQTRKIAVNDGEEDDEDARSLDEWSVVSGSEEGIAAAGGSLYTETKQH